MSPRSSTEGQKTKVHLVSPLFTYSLRDSACLERAQIQKNTPNLTSYTRPLVTPHTAGFQNFTDSIGTQLTFHISLSARRANEELRLRLSFPGSLLTFATVGETSLR